LASVRDGKKPLVRASGFERRLAVLELSSRGYGICRRLVVTSLLAAGLLELGLWLRPVGEEIERLTGRALQGDLSPDELDRMVEQQGDALARRVLEAKKMLTRVDGLLAADQALIDEINAIIGERQLPSEHELILFLNSFLAGHYPGAQLPERVVREVVSVALGTTLGLALESSSVDLGHDAAIFGRKISTGTVDITLSREAGFRHPRAEVIQLQHPLTRFAVSEISKEKDLKKSAFALSLRTKRLPAGQYGFLVSLIHVRSQRAITKLVALFTDWNSAGIVTEGDDATAILIEMLENSTDLKDPAPLEGVGRVKEKLVAALNGLNAIGKSDVAPRGPSRRGALLFRGFRATEWARAESAIEH
jgi:hypothetical protein